jgi:AAA+ ATPase superfamily predicted ATPase
MRHKVAKPAGMHGRDQEWADLTRFATNSDLGATLGLVYGRRRQGKTFLLAHLVAATGGLMFTGLPQTSEQNLRDLAEAYARYKSVPEYAFASWRAAIDELMRLGENADRPVPVVLDEFPFLLDGAPVDGLIQVALEPLSRAQQQSRTRLILCGSALTTMRRLLGGTAPLRGRASLEVVVHPFGFRDAARFWDLTADPELAFRVHALVGGTLAYYAMAEGPPAHRVAFDEWVAGHLLNPSSAMFREGNVLLSEEPELTDQRLYHSVLAAISRGAHRRGEIAKALGRPDSAVAHPLAVLERLQLVARLEDALRERRSVYRIAEPVIRLHQLVIRPFESALVAGEAMRAWTARSDTIAATIYGPHLEDLTREWCLRHASEATLGGWPSKVLPTTVACREHRQGHEVDVVAMEDRPFEARRLLAIGEVRSMTKLVDEGELARLRHIRTLLPADLAPQPPKLLLFSRTGFSDELQRAATAARDVELVDLERLYLGD